MSARSWTAPALWRFGNGHEIHGDESSWSHTSVTEPTAAGANRSQKQGQRSTNRHSSEMERSNPPTSHLFDLLSRNPRRLDYRQTLTEQGL